MRHPSRGDFLARERTRADAEIGHDPLVGEAGFAHASLDLGPQPRLALGRQRPGDLVGESAYGAQVEERREAVGFEAGDVHGQKRGRMLAALGAFPHPLERSSE